MSVVLCNTLKAIQRRVSSIQCVCRLQVPSHQRNDCDLFSFKVHIVLNLICVTVYILLRISRFLTSQEFTYLLSSYTQEMVNNGL